VPSFGRSVQEPRTPFGNVRPVLQRSCSSSTESFSLATRRLFDVYPCHEKVPIQQSPRPENNTTTRLENKGGTLGLLVTTVGESIINTCCCRRPCMLVETYPSSKCLQRLRASCALVLHDVHSSLRTTFLVVFAFLWKTGLV